MIIKCEQGSYVKNQNLLGKIFGKLTVIEKSDKKSSNGVNLWNCKCVCGNFRVASTSDLNRGDVKSCGCTRLPSIPAIDPRIRFYKNIEVNEGCWEWKGSRYKTGYGQFSIKNKQITAHRASWIIHYGEIPKGLHVCHKCDNRICANPQHLFLGTPKDNTQDMIVKGRKPDPWNKVFSAEQEKQMHELYLQGCKQRDIAKKFGTLQSSVWHIIRKFEDSKSLMGEGNCNAKFNDEDIIKIRSMFVPYKMSCVKIAKLYGVHVTTIQRIIYRQTWSHVP